MEFPHLGKQCNFTSCNQLDFLPVKCDACQKTFCNDHYQYENHSCAAAYKKDVQVPVCPLCNSPVPGKSSELPDIRVSRHIDYDCQSDRAVTRRKKVYANRCSVKGCKQKELIPLVCDNCTQNYCLRHRHPQDHSCQHINAKPLNKAAAAAISRTNKNNSRSHSNDSRINGQQPGRSTASAPVAARAPYSQSSIQGNLSDDAALQIALQASLSSSNNPQDQLSQEQADFLLAQAIAQSEEEARRNAGTSRGTGIRSHRNCHIS